MQTISSSVLLGAIIAFAWQSVSDPAFENKRIAELANASSFIAVVQIVGSPSWIRDPSIKEVIVKEGSQSSVSYDFDKAYIGRLFGCQLLEILKGNGRKLGDGVNVFITGNGNSPRSVANPNLRGYYLVFLARLSRKRIPDGTVVARMDDPAVPPRPFDVTNAYVLVQKEFGNDGIIRLNSAEDPNIANVKRAMR